VYSNIASKLAVVDLGFGRAKFESSLMSSLAVSSTLDAYALFRIMLNLVVDLGSYATG
jgi:hypothetical protein